MADARLASWARSPGGRAAWDRATSATTRSRGGGSRAGSSSPPRSARRSTRRPERRAAAGPAGRRRSSAIDGGACDVHVSLEYELPGEVVGIALRDARPGTAWSRSSSGRTRTSRARRGVRGGAARPTIAARLTGERRRSVARMRASRFRTRRSSSSSAPRAAASRRSRRVTSPRSEVLSSDAFREILSGDAADQRATKTAFSILHREVTERLAAGRTRRRRRHERRASRPAGLLARARLGWRSGVAIVLALPRGGRAGTERGAEGAGRRPGHRRPAPRTGSRAALGEGGVASEGFDRCRRSVTDARRASERGRDRSRPGPSPLTPRRSARSPAIAAAIPKTWHRVTRSPRMRPRRGSGRHRVERRQVAATSSRRPGRQAGTGRCRACRTGRRATAVGTTRRGMRHACRPTTSTATMTVAAAILMTTSGPKTWPSGSAPRQGPVEQADPDPGDDGELDARSRAAIAPAARETRTTATMPAPIPARRVAPAGRPGRRPRRPARARRSDPVTGATTPIRPTARP